MGEITIGSKVRLKSGIGPTMIADGESAGGPGEAISLMACYWFTSDMTYQRADFRLDHLEKDPNP